MYNVSWYVKTQNAGAANGGATVNIDWYDVNHSYISTFVGVDATIGTIDWIRRGARVDAPGGAAYAKLTLTLNDAGTAWFDDIQMEEGAAINQYNFISNSGFESEEDGQTGPDFWYTGALGSNDGADASVSRTGVRSLLVHGVSGANKYFNYDVIMTGSAGDAIYFSGWSKAQGVTSSGGYYGLLLYIKYTDGTEAWIPAPFTKSTHDWEFAEGVYAVGKDYSFFGIYGKLENQTGQAWFDDMTLRFAAAGNALISRYNILQNDRFERPNSTGSWPDFWPAFYDTEVPGTYDIAWPDSTPDLKAFTGNKMIRISNVPSWAVVINNINEPLQTGKTYTAYGAVKTDGVAGSGAVVSIDIMDSGGVYLGQKSSKALTGTNDWTVVSVSLSEAEAKQISADASMIRVSAGARGATSGQMYFDMVRLIDERAETTYEYETAGNYITAVTDETGNKTLTARDSRGNITAQTDPKGYTSSMEYDPADRLTAAENPLGLRTEYEYDKNGNITQIVNKDINTGSTLSTSAIAYNELGLVKNETDPLNRTTSYEYDKNGNMTKIGAPNGNDILYTAYDRANRLKNVSYADDATTWAYDYDRNDNLTSVTKNGGEQTQFTYDAIDRLSAVTYPSVGGVANSAEYAYSPVDKYLSITHSPVSSTQPAVRYEYDKNDMLVKLYDPNNGSAEFMHNTEGRLRKSYYSSRYMNYRDYNSKGQITRVHTKHGSGTRLVDTVYAFDPNGNIIRETFMDNSYTAYEYDQINQLTAERYYNPPAPSQGRSRINTRANTAGFWETGRKGP